MELQGEAWLLQRKCFWGMRTYCFVGNEYRYCTVPQSFPVTIHISLVGARRGGREGQWRRLSPNILLRMTLSSWEWPMPLLSPRCFFACWELLRCILKLEVHYNYSRSHKSLLSFKVKILLEWQHSLDVSHWDIGKEMEDSQRTRKPLPFRWYRWSPGDELPAPGRIAGWNTSPSSPWRRSSSSLCRLPTARGSVGGSHL